MKILLLGDVGADAGYHAGDEAMAEAVVEELGDRTEVSVIAVSHNPQDTVERYGWETVPRIGFDSPSWSDSERDSRLEAVLSAAAGDMSALDWADTAWRVIEAVAEVDAIVISGGGNLNSNWPEHVYERAALGQLAAIFKKRHVVTGQTIGPHLTARHGELVARLLTSAALVATREEASHDVALRLGVLPERLVRVVDDATYLRPDATDLELPNGPYVAATFSPYGGPLEGDVYASAIADLLDYVASSTAMPVVLVPHQAKEDDGNATGDTAMHAQIASKARTASIRALPTVSARQAAAITANAALVISTRYHPVVFALAASVPALGIAVDAYTSTKIKGAMENFGVGDFALPIASLTHGDAHAAFDDVHQRASEIKAHLERANVVRRKDAAAWWDAVSATLTGTEDATPVAGLEPVEGFAGGSWSIASRSLLEWSSFVSARYEGERLQDASSRLEVQRLELRVAELEREGFELSARLDSTTDEVESLRESTKAAHKLVSDAHEPLLTWLADLPTITALRAELDAVYNQRSYRYLRRPRQIYAKLRSLR